MSNVGTGCVIVLVLLWLLINVGDALWISYYAITTVNPNPHNIINRTGAGYNAYQVMMFIFGFVWGGVNLVAGYFYFGTGKVFKDGFMSALTSIFNYVVVLPVFIFLIIMPFFGGWIVVPIMQTVAWKHHCDSYPMYAIIDGKGYSDPSYVSTVVHFYQQNTPYSMFTYDISNPSGSGDYWNFNLREWDQNQGVVPVQFYPTLQQLTYNYINNTFSGNCTVPVPGGVGGDNTTLGLCTQGSFFPGNFLTLNVSSSVPLNTTTSNITTLPFNNTQLRTRDNQWAFTSGHPSLILETLDAENQLQGYTVMETTVTKRGDCTQLKVCLNGVNGQVAGPVGAEILVPLGIITLRQSDNAIQCTTPTDSGGD